MCDESTSLIDAKELRAESMKRLVQFAVLPTAAIEGDECCPLPKSPNAQTFVSHLYEPISIPWSGRWSQSI